MEMKKEIKKRRNLILVITEACNLACGYCYEHSKSSRTMDFGTAKALLDHEFSDPSWDFYDVQLLGGEPLLAFELIKELDRYIFEELGRKDVRLFIVTNGTLMNEEKQAWFSAPERHGRIICGLSIDGVKAAQDRARSRSFDLIPIDFFAKTWPEQSCRITIHSTNIEYLSESVRFLHERGFSIQAAFAQCDEPWVTSDILCIFKRELQKIVEFYLERPDLPLMDMLSVNFSALAAPVINKDQPHCGAGKELASYGIDGSCYPCHTFSSVSIGERARDFIGKTIEDLNYRISGRCRDCVLLACCPTCMGINVIARGDAALRDLSVCEMHKLRFLAASKLAYFREFSERCGELSSEEFCRLAGIARVQSAFGAEIALPAGVALSNAEKENFTA